jgi:hypothetical protein
MAKQCYVVYGSDGICWFADSSESADEWIGKQGSPNNYKKYRKEYPTFIKALEYFKRSR